MSSENEINWKIINAVNSTLDNFFAQNIPLQAADHSLHKETGAVLVNLLVDFSCVGIGSKLLKFSSTSMPL